MPSTPEHLEFFALERSPFADEAHAGVVVGTRSLRKVVARIQAALRDGAVCVGVGGVPGVGKSGLARALPKLFAGRTRVASIFEPETQWTQIRSGLARDWRLSGGRLSRPGLVEAARGDRLVLVIDRAERAPESLFGHLDALQSIRNEAGTPVVTTILFVQRSADESEERCAALRWLEQARGTLLRFEPLAPDAVADFIDRHLARAGRRGGPIFTPRAALAIHGETGGVPGEIGLLCERLLIDAAARRLRTIDEPFVRARGEGARPDAPHAERPALDLWDDADHHPRETPSPPQRPERPERSEPPDAAERADPSLEAWLSAPPSAAELRAIRGGFVRRQLRPFALLAAAVVLGGLGLAQLLRRPEDGRDANVAGAADPATDGRAASARDGGASGAGAGAAGDGTSTPLVLGRVRGPIVAPTSAPARSPRSAPRRSARPVEPAASPLRPAGELDDGDLPLLSSAPPAATPRIDPREAELPDFRPKGLAPPAAPGSAHE